MPQYIRKVAVLGAGVMGTGIAAHLANAGIPSYLLDIVPRDLSDAEKNDPAARNRLSANSVQAALKSKPATFMHPGLADLITVGNMEDHMEWLKEVDWVIEVVVENPKIKQAVFANVEKHVGPNTIITSNTSGIPISVMTEGRSEDFKRRFLVTHFFNPVRYMKLLELVPSPTTDPAILSLIAEFGEKKLGKGIVWGKDTPNFVGNRIGVQGMMACMHYMVENGYTISEVDAIVGEPLGRPKTAAFKTADLVGLDTLIHVANNCYESLTNDEDRDVFKVPAFVQGMVEKRYIGDKAGKGFYAKDGKARLVINPATLEYEPAPDKIRFDSLKKAKDEENVAKKIKIMAYADDRAGKLVWDLMKRTLPYAARRVGEIADDVVNIDNGMKWGYNFKLGPFETWDAIGVRESVAKMQAEGVSIPANVLEMLNGGNESFYKTDESGTLFYYDFPSKSYKPVHVPKEEISLAVLKKKKENIVKRNGGASLVDLGDGVLCVEFATKMNSIDDDIIAMLETAVETVETGDWAGLVIGNQAENYSVGANLMLIWMGAQGGQWDVIDQMAKRLQKAVMGVKYCKKPTVTAPFGLTLGGGCEVAMHSWRTVAAGETYIGLVELGAGVVPAGGGCKEMVLRQVKSIGEGVEVDVFPFVRKAFETIGMAYVATSAREAKAARYLRDGDIVVLNKDHLLYEAKQNVLAMAQEGFDPGRPATDLRLPGPDGAATLKLGLMTMKQGGFISEHDFLIGSKLAHIMTGGNTNPLRTVSEWDLLDLEREAFLSLCGEVKSQERMQSLLMTGKPLRN